MKHKKDVNNGARWYDLQDNSVNDDTIIVLRVTLLWTVQ